MHNLNRRIYMAIISRRMLAVTLIAGITTGLAGGAGPAAAHAGSARGPVRGGTLRVALPVDAGTLDPRLAQDTSAWAVDSLIFNGLVSITNNLTPVPDLATSWKQVNAKTWVFYLRKGVKFS